MADDHVVEMHKSVRIIKYIQSPLAILVLAFSAYCVHYTPVPGPAFGIFTALWTIGATIYWRVATRIATQAYNWVALLVLESLSVLFWLISFALLADLYVTINSVHPYYAPVCYNFYYCRKKRDTYVEVEQQLVAYVGLLIAAMVLSVIEFILFCVTLTFMGIGINRHRMDGRPMMAGSSYRPAQPPAQEMTTPRGAAYGGQPTYAQQPPYPTQEPTYSGV